MFARELFQFCSYAFDDSLPFDEQLPVKALKLALGTPQATHSPALFPLRVTDPTHPRPQRGTMR